MARCGMALVVIFDADRVHSEGVFGLKLLFQLSFEQGQIALCEPVV